MIRWFSQLIVAMVVVAVFMQADGGSAPCVWSMGVCWVPATIDGSMPQE